MSNPSSSMIGFIDLLGTKESSRISEEKFYGAIRKFLFTLVSELRELDPDAYVFQYLSDSAFFELKTEAASFEFLRTLRRRLFDQRIFFKCALIPGQLKPQNINRAFLEEIVKENSENYLARSYNFDAIENNLHGFFFSDETIKAYLLHEVYKGVGFVASDALVQQFPNEFVKSIYYTSDTFKSANSFHDLRFSVDREVAKWSEDVDTEFDIPVGWTESSAFIRNFISSAEIAAYKRGSYAKYYIPTLISMVRSSDFSTVQISDKSLDGTPAIYRRVINDAKQRKAVGNLKGIFDVQCVLLDEILNFISKSLNETDVSEEIQDLEDMQERVCREFILLPRFRSSIQHSKPRVLSPRNRETFLETIVRG
jgi:hypothetical protein